MALLQSMYAPEFAANSRGRFVTVEANDQQLGNDMVRSRFVGYHASEQMNAGFATGLLPALRLLRQR